MFSDPTLKDFAEDVLNMRIVQNAYRDNGCPDFLERKQMILKLCKKYETIVDEQIVGILNLPEVNALNFKDHYTNGGPT